MPRSISIISSERAAARSRISDLTEQQLAIDAKAKAENRDLDAGELERLSRLASGTDKARAELDKLDDEARGALRVLASDPANLEAADVGAPVHEPSRSALRSQASRTIDALHATGALPDQAAERAEGLLTDGKEHTQTLAASYVAAAGDPHYLGAFRKLMADPDRGHLTWTREEGDAYRALADVQTQMRAASLTIGGGGTGGYMVPLTLDPAIVLTSTGTTNAMRQHSRVVSTMTNTWTGVSSAGATAEWPGEATQVADGTPALGQISIPVYLGDAFAQFSFAVAMDALDFTSELQRVLMSAADELMATAYTTGAGSTEPTGVVTALTGGASEINGTGSEAIIAADPISLQNALPARFSPNAKFMAHIATINTLASLETTNGALRFPEIANGRLLNRPLVENSDMDGAINPAATANNYVLVYGDFREYIIADRIGSTLEIIPNIMGANNRPTGERGALLWFRTGGNVSTINAFRLLDVPTAE